MKNEDKLYSELDDKHLIGEYDSWLIDYKKWLDKEIDLSETWSEEVHYMVFMRDEIHQVIAELTIRDHSFDKAKIVDLDSAWQKWILKNTDEGFALENPRENIPRNLWWWWVDKLNELTEKERATL